MLRFLDYSCVSVSFFPISLYSSHSMRKEVAVESSKTQLRGEGRLNRKIF